MWTICYKPNYFITGNFNGNECRACHSPSVYVKREGVILVKMYCGTLNNPLGYIQKNPRAPERQEFVRQLLENNVSPQDVEMLLRVLPSRYMISKMKRVQNG